MSDRTPHRSLARGRPAATRVAQRLVGIVAVAALGLSAATATAAASDGSNVKTVPFASGTQGPSGPPGVAAPAGPNKVRYLALPYKNAKSKQQLAQAGLAGTTVPTTAYSVTAGQNGQSYTFSLVGGNVTAGSSTTNVSGPVVGLIVTFTGTGDVYNPTTVNSGCGETVSAMNGLLNGAELTHRNWYAGSTFVGHTQYMDALQREEFWSWTRPGGTSPNYHVFLNGSNPTNATYSINAPEASPGTCNALGEIDLGTFDSAVQSFLNGRFGSTTVPIILLKNVVLTQNGGATCCILGYHSAFTDSSGNTQTYSVGDYITDGQFGSNVTDLVALSHEIAEWANDPFVNNPTPSWGHTGQVSGCQGNLEVGDPLSGTTFGVPPTTPGGGPTYHLQDLAFFGWFYDFNSGVNGWYSTRGTFRSGATLCS